MSETQREQEPQPGLREELERHEAERARESKDLFERLTGTPAPEPKPEQPNALAMFDLWDDILKGNVCRPLVEQSQAAFTLRYFAPMAEGVMS